MKYTYKGALSCAPKLLTISMLSLVLVACGGGTSGDGTDTGTVDGADSGTTDFGDLTGLDDGGTTEGGTDDGFVGGDAGADSNGNGISDEDEAMICLGQGGNDEESNNPEWNDNCIIRVGLRGGAEGASPFYNSTYATGIQRVLYCSGVAPLFDTTVSFADGFFGDGTAEAVRAFQQAENDEVAANQLAGISDVREVLIVDGIVGPNTWARLQTKVLDVEVDAFIANEDNTGGNYDVFGVLASTYATGADVDCSNERNFMGLVNNDSAVIGEWRLTDVPGGTGVKSFSIDIN